MAVSYHGSLAMNHDPNGGSWDTLIKTFRGLHMTSLHPRITNVIMKIAPSYMGTDVYRSHIAAHWDNTHISTQTANVQYVTGNDPRFVLFCLGHVFSYW